MDDIKKLENTRKRYLSRIVIRIILIMAIFLAVVAFLLFAFNVIKVKPVYMLTILFFVVFVPALGTVFTVNKFNEYKIEYIKEYNDVFLKKALLYNANAVMDCSKNLFSERDRLKETRFIYLDSWENGFTTTTVNYENHMFFNGNYRNSHIEGTNVYCYYSRVSPENNDSEYDERIYRSDRYSYFGTVGEVSNIKYKGRPIIIYHRDYPTKKLLSKFKDYSTVTTGNEDFDRTYIITSIVPDVAREFFSEDVINIMMEISKYNKPFGIHIIGGKLVFSILSMNIRHYPTVFKQIDYDKEFYKVNKEVGVYFNLLDKIVG